MVTRTMQRKRIPVNKLMELAAVNAIEQLIAIERKHGNGNKKVERERLVGEISGQLVVGGVGFTLSK